MILLWLLILVSLANADSTVSNVRVHYAEMLEQKCDNLLYRSYYSERTCYFAVNKETFLENAKEYCEAAFPGAKLIRPAKEIVRLLFLQDAEFHHPLELTWTRKYALCRFDTRMECASKLYPLMPGGKCAIRPNKKMTYPEAVDYCASKSAVLPVIHNAEDQQSLYGILMSIPAWLGTAVGESGWSSNHDFSWFTGCKAANLSPPHSRQPFCSPDAALVALPKGEGQTYTGINDQTNLQDVICIQDAATDFWTWNRPAATEAPISTTPSAPVYCKSPRKHCSEDHRYDPAGFECDWTGPKDACLKLIDKDNKTWYMKSKDLSKWEEVDLLLTNNPFNDQAVGTVIRRGCRASFWAYSANVPGNWMVREDLWYGKYTIPSYHTGELSKLSDGATRLLCTCYVFNKVEPEPEQKNCSMKHPADYCEEDHRYDPTTGECEWFGSKDACVKLIDKDKQSWYLNNPDPKWVEVDLWKTQSPFNDLTVRAIVRRGCRADFWAHSPNTGHDSNWKLLADKWYGAYPVPNYYTGGVRNIIDGLSRVGCVCYFPMKTLEPIENS